MIFDNQILGVITRGLLTLKDHDILDLVQFSIATQKGLMFSKELSYISCHANQRKGSVGDDALPL